MSPPSYLVLLLLVASIHGVLAEDIDENIAAAVFGALIVIFAIIGIIFLIMIIRLRRKLRQRNSRDQPDVPAVKSGIVRYNTDRGIVGYTKRQDSSLGALPEESVTYPSTFTNHTYDHQTSSDPLITSQLSFSGSSLENPALVRYTAIREEVTISPTQPATSHDPDNSPPDYYQLTNKERPTSPSDVASNVSNHVDTDEKKEDLSTTKCTEEDKAPVVNGGLHSDTVNNSSELSPHEQPPVTNKPHSTREDDVTVTVSLETNTTDQVSSVTNGAVTGVGTTTTNTLANGSPSSDTRPSPTTRKKKLFGLFGGKEKPRRDSQKPLLNSQSSQTSGDSPPQLKGITPTSTADLPETFYEQDEQPQNIESRTVYIPHMEESSL